MDDMQLAWPFLIPIVGTICTFAYIIVATLSRARVRELEVRERIAMIERGLVPAPEADPRGFERAMTRHDTVVMRKTPARFRAAGIIIMGVGMGLMLLIGFAGGEPGAAIGVGGAICVLGLAFFINSLFSGGTDVPVQSYSPPSPLRPPAASAPTPPEQRID